ncbi:MAG: cobalamin-dependent protein, partial [Firmicutes bacterium]|nr:cobalamin-dependent protein [Bacillota bacterium]
MRQKKVLLIYPYFYTGMVKDQLFSPLGISILSGILKQRQIDVMKLDCTFMTFDEAIKKAEAYKPDITGIYVMTTLAKNAVELLKTLREVNPDSHYVAGGPLPSLYPEKFAKEFDHVFVGEAAKSFPGFCDDFFKASETRDFLKNIQMDQYPGLYGKMMDLNDLSPGYLSSQEIDACPKPDRHGFNHKKYQEVCHQATGYKRASIMMTYGCQFSCDFCSKPIFGNKVRFRDLDRIFEEIEDIRSYGYDTLWIADDLFTYNPEFLKRFCQRLIEEKWNIKWSCLSRVDGITDEMVGLM